MKKETGELKDVSASQGVSKKSSNPGGKQKQPPRKKFKPTKPVPMKKGVANKPKDTKGKGKVTGT